MDVKSKDPEQPEDGASAIDLTQLLRAVWRRRWLVLAVAAVVTLGVGVRTLRQPKVYASEAQVIIDVTAPRFLDTQVQEVMNDERSNYWFNKEYSETQHRIITSRTVAQRVVDKLGLQTDLSFLGLERLEDPADRQRALALADAPGLLQSRLKVVPVKNSRVVGIEVEDVDPERAALLANEVADAYVAENLALRLRMTESASRWLEERLGELEEKTRRSELAVYDFKKTSDLLTTSLDNRLSIVSERLGAYNTALTEVRTRIASLRARARAFRDMREAAADRPWVSEGYTFSESKLLSEQEMRLLTDLRGRYFAARAECAELKERYLEHHPRLGACQERLAVLEGDARREFERVAMVAETELAAALANERNLLELVATAKQEAFEVNKKQLEFDRLQREATNDQRLYDVVLKRLKDIELSGMLRTSNVRLLDPARPSPTPVRPNLARWLLVALALGLLLGVGSALLLDQLDSSLRTPGEVEELLGVPLLGACPSLPVATSGSLAERDLHVFRHPSSPASEAMRAVRTNILFSNPDSPPRTLLVTSSGPQEGKSSVVVSLGIAMAKSGSRVLLLDTDMRRPRLHLAFGLPNDEGVSSLVVHDGTMDRAVRSTEVPGLFVLPCGPLPPNPAELLHTRAFAELLAQLSERFDRIILDSPPVNAVADALVLSTQVDSVLTVVRARHTPRQMARRMLRALADVKATVIGVVLNDVDVSADLGSYSYSYSYAQAGPEDLARS